MNESLSSMIVPGVLWALVLFSVVSWALLLIKSSQYLRQKKQNKLFSKAFWAAPDLLTAAEHASQYPGALARIGVVAGGDHLLAPVLNLTLARAADLAFGAR